MSDQTTIMKPILLLLFPILLIAGCAGNDGDSNQPSGTFIAFAKELKKQQLVPDTERVKRHRHYPELDPARVSEFRRLPFYPISPEKSKLYEKAQKKPGSKVETVQSIWAYFYREKDARIMVTDGVIEEWQFPDKQIADRVLRQFIDLRDAAFFNTIPYYCRQENRVYVFHARAALFSDHQKDVFERFIKKTEAYVEN